MQILNKVFVKRSFNCSKSRLFEWLVQADHIIEWFGPKHLSVGNVTTNVYVGGTYSIELVGPEDRSFFIEGEYLEVSPPDQIKFTFQYRGSTSPPPNSTVNIQLEELHPKRTVLILTQDFEITPPDMDNRTQAWEHMLETLETMIHA